MFVALSTFKVATGNIEEVAEAFRNRPGLVDQAAGFVKMEVMRPADDDAAFWLMTCWQDQTSFETWHRSHAFKAVHANLPNGLKLVPGANRVSYLRVIAQ